MGVSLRDQIASNRRGSILFMFGLVVLLTALGGCLVGIYSPKNWIIGAVGSALFAVLAAVIAKFSGSGLMVSIAGGREATHEEDQVLDNVVEEMAIAAGIPKPKIYVIDDPAPNAFATGPNPQHGVICVTTGLLGKLDRDELQGVIAHEMSHIRNYDIQFMTVAGIIAGLIPMLAYVFRNSLWYGGGRRSSNDNDSGTGIFMIVGLILSILAPIFSALLQLAISRKREFLADASGAQLTRYPEGLARALIKLQNDQDVLVHANPAMQHMYIVNPLHINASSLWDTHPTTQDRVHALMGLRGNQAEALGATPPMAGQ